MDAVDSIPPLKLWFYSRLAALRPITVGSRLKRILGIGRLPFRLPSGLVLWIDPVSFLGLHILRTGEFEPKLTRLFENVLRPGDVLFDIGANEGYYTTLGATLVGGDGKVLAVEPQSRLHHVFMKNLEFNGLVDRVVLEKRALLEEPGSVQLHLTPDVNTGATSARRTYRHSSQMEEVPATTLDLLHEESGFDAIRLIKIDCEGAEPNILSGGQKLITSGKVDFFLIEYHPMISRDEEIAASHDLLLKAGYQFHELDPMYRLYFLPRVAADLPEALVAAP